MSKGRHTRDRMYISASEHAQYGTGYRAGGSSGSRQKLLGDFRNCALSMQPFTDPVATPDGSLFDLINIVPFLRKHGKHPISGEVLSAKDLVHLNFHRNTEGEFACPVTNKVFNEHTKIVAIRTTGNVYAWDAIANLCIATKNWKDLLTDEPFTRADILTLQDPTNADWLKKRDVNTFFHVRAGAGGAGAAGSAASAGAGSTTASGSSSSDSGSTGVQQVIRSDDTTKRVLAELAEKERDGSMPTITGAKRRREDGEGADGSSGAAAGGAGAGAAGGAGGGHVTGYGVKTTGRYTASFTSTGMSLVTRNEAAAETPADRRERRWAAAKKLGKKAYVRIATSKGDLNVELHADLTPRCVDNFLALARRGYYDKTIMHRLVRNFIVQGGDPTGTGRGGDSAWGGAFADEFHSRLSHGERGVLSMANSGPNSNKSQFFFVLAPAAASHLDNKHSVFGRIVGGLDVLRAIEQVPTRASEAAGRGGTKAAAALAADPDRDRPLQDIGIEGITVFADPFAELEAAGAIPTLAECGSGSGGGGSGAAAGSSSAAAGGSGAGVSGGGRPAAAVSGTAAGAGIGTGAGGTARATPPAGSVAGVGVGAGGGSLLLSMLPAPGTGGAGSSGAGAGAGTSAAATAPPPGSAAIAAAAAARAAAAASSGSAISGGGASIAARLAAGTSATAAPGRVVTPAEVAAARTREAERAAVTWMSDPAPKPSASAAGAAGAGAGVGRYLPPATATAAASSAGGVVGSRAGAASSSAAAGAEAGAGAGSAADREALLAAAMAAGLEAAPQPKRKPAAGSFGDFSGW